MATGHLARRRRRRPPPLDPVQPPRRLDPVQPPRHRSFSSFSDFFPSLSFPLRAHRNGGGGGLAWPAAARGRSPPPWLYAERGTKERRRRRQGVVAPLRILSPACASSRGRALRRRVGFCFGALSPSPRMQRFGLMPHRDCRRWCRRRGLGKVHHLFCSFPLRFG